LYIVRAQLETRPIDSFQPLTYW